MGMDSPLDTWFCTSMQLHCMFAQVTTVVPESHLQMLGTNGDVIALRQVSTNGPTVVESLESKLEATRMLHFIYDSLVSTYVQPNGRLHPTSADVFDLKQKVCPILKL